MSVDKEEWRSRAGAEADLHWVYAPPDARRELCVRVSHWVCRQTEQGTSPLKRIAERNHKTFKTRLQVGCGRHLYLLRPRSSGGRGAARPRSFLLP